MVRLDVKDNKIYLETDDGTIKSLLEYRHTETKYNPFQKKWMNIDIIDRLYLRKSKKGGTYTFELGMGMIPYLINCLGDYIMSDDKNKLLKEVYSDCPRMAPFPGLYPVQNEDLLFALKYKRALINLPTGSGKSQMIATLVQYFYKELGKKTLIMTPSKKSMEEIVKRIKKLFSIDVMKDQKAGLPVGCIVSAGVMNSKKFKDPSLLPGTKKELASYEVIFIDECEYSLGNNPGGGHLVMDLCTGAKYIYAFSGTSSKIDGQMISWLDENGKFGLNKSIANSKYLVEYVSASTIFRMPLNKTLNFISAKTDSLDKIVFSQGDYDSEGNVYMEIMAKIWQDPGVIKDIYELAQKYKPLFIPINLLDNAILIWFENVFKGKMNTMVISGTGKTGITYTDILGGTRDIDLQEASDICGKDDNLVILGTSSSYRAIDLERISSILLTSNSIAGVVLQQIGRVIRRPEVDIIELMPKSGKRIPIHSKGVKKRRELIEGYYKYCKLNYFDIEL